MRAENEKRHDQGHHHSSIVANAALVFQTYGNIGEDTSHYSQEKRATETTESRGKNKTDGLQSVRNSFRKRGFSEDSTKIFLLSWKSGTKKQYNTHINRWFRYCAERQVSPVSPALETVIEFFTEQFNKGLGYESLNRARGALSALGINFEGFRVGNHPLVTRYMK